jgi:hypothetical protein
MTGITLLIPELSNDPGLEEALELPPIVAVVNVAPIVVPIVVPVVEVDGVIGMEAEGERNEFEFAIEVGFEDEDACSVSVEVFVGKSSVFCWPSSLDGSSRSSC